VKHLDLFSGVGGFALAARNVGWHTVAFCEPDPYCQAVLRKHWPDVPIHDDVRELKADAVGSVDIITGGYPCQPFSLAGKRGGANDDRHLWPAMFALVESLRPAWVIGENVAGHISMGLDDVLADLEGSGYTCRTFVIPAVAVDAKHRRDRVWTVAYDGIREPVELPGGKPECRMGAGFCGQNVANPARDEQGRQEQWPKRKRAWAGSQSESLGNASGIHAQGRQDGQGEVEPWRAGRWLPEPELLRMVDGLSEKLDGDRLNAYERWLQASCPQNADGILRAVREYENAVRASHRRRLDEQQPIEYPDAVLVVSYILASQSGRHRSDETEAAMQGLRQAVISLYGATLQHSSNPFAEIWQSVTCEKADWLIVAACLGSFWSEWPEIPRVAKGISRRVDRLKALGNAIVPQVAERIFEAIKMTEYSDLEKA